MNDDALPATLWEGRPASFWRERWQLPQLLVFERVGSTNDVARELATAGAPAGSTVIAELQSAGRGRFGRRWQAPAGSALLLSCLLRPQPAGDSAPGTIPLRVGLAAAQAVSDVCGVHISLKWPNDLVVAGAGKLGGVLCEAVTTGAAWCVVAGIGMNVRQRAADWPTELTGVATSLDDVIMRDQRRPDANAPGATTDRPRLAAALLERLRPLFDAPAEPLTAAELAAYATRDLLAGTPIIVEQRDSLDDPASRTWQGTGAGIAPDGALLLHTATGEQRITTGTIRIADGQRPRSTQRTQS